MLVRRVRTFFPVGIAAFKIAVFLPSHGFCEESLLFFYLPLLFL